MSMIRRRVIVHGIVQGVGFRYLARAEADRLQVAGWVRNRADGTVEAEVEGAEDDVAAMIAWLNHGPTGASVDRIDVTAVPPGQESGFRITS
ncbi:MAG: acylphosphatase [Leifsonia sp.]